jgi:ribosomal protein S18 acetylase RimI-like enzyme
VVSPDPAPTDLDGFRIDVSDPFTSPARDLVRDYFREILTRFNGHTPTSEDVDAAMGSDPDDAMVSPTGVFIVALSAHSPVGCAGLRLLNDRVGELKRVYVCPAARGRGLGAALVTTLEEYARSRGLTAVRLDTRHELDEALRLYERHGYRRIERYNKPGLADLWFEKTINTDETGAWTITD